MYVRQVIGVLFVIIAFFQCKCVSRDGTHLPVTGYLLFREIGKTLSNSIATHFHGTNSKNYEYFVEENDECYFSPMH